MPFLPLRQVVLPDATEHLYETWLQELARRLERPDCDRNELCRELLTDLYYPELRDRPMASLSSTSQLALAQMDPRNVTLESEYYADIDAARFAPVKPLLWLWEMFDKSPAGENVELGVRFRRVLAHHIFRRCGRNFKCFQFVKFSFGYNIEAGDDVVIHRYVLLNDRGGIVLGDRSSVADYGNVYSHTHDLGDQRVVSSPVTTLEEGTRLTYHATLLAGNRMERDSMLGAMAVATKDVPAGYVAVGIPAVPKIQKPTPEARAKLPATSDPLAGLQDDAAART